MKGDFSRLRHNSGKHYTSVLQQQGRVALDADANEQCAINEQIRATETIDVVGPFGGPQADAGFAISLSGNSIQIGAGRYYVEGLLCENASPVGYLRQPLLINPPLSDSQILSGLQKGTYSSIQVFLEVWQRLITALDDPCLLEPALGQADTTVRLQTVWRVVAQTVAPTVASSVSSSAVAPTAVLQQSLSVNRAVLAAASAPGLTINPIVNAPQPDCCVSMYTPPVPLAKGKLSAQTGGTTSDCSCQPTPAAGYRGLENQLYRVEIHQGGSEANSTFKWSRENASVVAGITQISGSQVLVDSLGFDANLGFAPGQWVEISDDTTQFGVPSNQPGQLYQIQSVTPAQRSLTVTPPVTGIDISRNPRARRWDQFGASAAPHGVPLSSSWLDLENGIQVQFTSGNYASGDYWLIPARTASGEIDWPPCGGDGTLFQPPHEITVFRAPLACIHSNANQQFNVEDCRRLFPPLTGVAGGALSALHVTGLNWSNDDILPFDQLLATGLTVSLDQTATGRIDSSTFFVVLEVPVVSQVEGYAVSTGLAPIVLRTSMPLDGLITMQGTGVNWNLAFRDSKGAINPIQLDALLILNALLTQGLSYSTWTRARVRLQGRDVFAGSGSSQAFLDGQTFGTAGFRADGVTPRIDLTFPSGSAARASDFESWFFLAPTFALLAITVTPATVTLTPSTALPTLSATLTVLYPALKDTVVTLSVIPPAGVPIAVTVPASVTVPRGKASVAFSAGVRNTQTPTAEAFQVVASLTNALGITATVSATVTITGYAVIQ